MLLPSHRFIVVIITLSGFWGSFLEHPELGGVREHGRISLVNRLNKPSLRVFLAFHMTDAGVHYNNGY